MDNSPMDPGTKVDGIIDTPMCSENVGKQNTPKTKVYPDMPSSSGGASIYGPGTKDTYKGGA